MKPTQEKQNEIELRKNPVNLFSCHHENCKNVRSLSFDEFKKHLFEVHALPEDHLKGNREMLMHIDGSYWFASHFQWTLDSGLVFSQYIRMARDKKNKMYH